MFNRKLVAVVSVLFACGPLAISFDPRAYSKSVATCKAIKRSPEPETVEIEIRTSPCMDLAFDRLTVN